MTPLAIVQTLVTLMVVVNGLPNYQFPSDWTSEEYLQYLMREQQQRMMRPVENPLFNTDNQNIGGIDGIDVNSSGVVHIFHRVDREWDEQTFSEDNVLSEDLKEPIDKPTILALDPMTGRIVGGFGAGLFSFPHGLKIDHHDNFWLTDVGMHQVFRLPKGSQTPDLTLGEAFVPGSDNEHFCKPTDVAVASNGEFFVADGYCNRRIMKFDKDGKFITKIGMADSEFEPASGPDPYSFNTPHSLTLVEDLDLLCVADRDNRRALCYNAGIHSNRSVGAFNRTLIPEGEMGRVYSIYYNQADNDVVAAAAITLEPFPMADTIYFPARAFTYALNGQQKAEWAYITPEIASMGPSLVHSICASPDGKNFYLADLLQKKVYKYSKLRPQLLAGRYKR